MPHILPVCVQFSGIQLAEKLIHARNRGIVLLVNVVYESLYGILQFGNACRRRLGLLSARFARGRAIPRRRRSTNGVATSLGIGARQALKRFGQARLLAKDNTKELIGGRRSM